MSVFPSGYGMVPSGMQYTLQPQYQGVDYRNSNYQMAQPLQQVVPIQQQQMVQQFQPQQQTMSMIGGKMVDSVKVVEAFDIPMDGSTYYFPKADGKEIYTKKWKDNGETETVVYKRDSEPPSQETKQFLDSFVCKDDLLEMQSGFNGKLDSILERIGKLEEAFR